VVRGVLRFPVSEAVDIRAGVTRIHFAIASLLLLLSACDEEELRPRDPLPATQVDAGVDAVADAPIEKRDGAFCPPPLGTPAPRPAARPAAGPLDDVLRMNHLQAKATHNSYHVQKPGALAEYAYTHQPLDVQLDAQGVRALELDVHFDDECQRHEVLHLPLIDDATTCRTLPECLGAVRKWSDGHLGHHPLFIMVEPKDDSAYEAALRLDVLEKEILSVFPREAIITPDEVKGDAPSVSAAIAKGWPTLAKTRGRVLFFLLASGGMRDEYTHAGKDLSGRLMFVSSSVGEPYASIAVIDEPTYRRDDIDASIAAGMIVRTLAEDFTALETAPAQSKAALESGAQMIATNYPAKIASSTWAFENPGTPSRCNVATAPSSCTSGAIESPDRLVTPR